MNRKFTLLFAAMVVLPLLASFWFASNALRTARADAIASASLLREQRSRDFSNKIAARMTEIKQAVSADLDGEYGSEKSSYSAKTKANPWATSLLNADRFILQRFQFSTTGELVSPDVENDSGPRVRAFLMATDSLRRDGLVFGRVIDEKGSPSTSGWHGWYHDEGWQLIYWKRRSNGVIDGAWINRPVLISDIIGQLPDTSAAGFPPTRKVSSLETYSEDDVYQLMGATETALYQWGQLSEEKPSAEVRVTLAEPLSAWTLHCYYEPPANLPLWAQRGALMIIFGTALFLALSYFFLREHRRKLREAQDRVSFVNQVSHELKTPLTNIQLYSELAASKLEDIDGGEPAQGNLAVIKHEAARLGRLIHNVLTFARDEKGTLTVNPKTIDIDPLVDEVIEAWRPSLENAGIIIERSGNASQCLADSDAIEQIIGNLISNVEKYAIDGQWIGIETSETSKHVVIRVSDHGPGIPNNQRNSIFDAFVRLDDRVNAKAAGSGLGLSIARRLMERMGGEISCRPDDTGCVFEFTLPKSNS